MNLKRYCLTALFTWALNVQALPNAANSPESNKPANRLVFAHFMVITVRISITYLHSDIS
jgi:hypothetical protein